MREREIEKYENIVSLLHPHVDVRFRIVWLLRHLSLDGELCLRDGKNDAFLSSSSPSSYYRFYVGSLCDDIRLHVAQSYTSSADSPFSLRSSFTLSNHLLLGIPLFLLPCRPYIHYHRPHSYVLFRSSHYKSIPLQPTFLYFLCDFPHFRCPSYSFISGLVQLRNSARPS